MKRSSSLTRCLGLLATSSLLACSSGSGDPDVATRGQSAVVGSGSPVVGLAGKCLDVRWADTTSGTPTQLWDCNATGAQAWTYTGGTLVGLAGKCLDVRGDVQASGTPVQLWDCNGTPAQQWTLVNGTIVSAGGLCLDVTGDDSTSGTPVQIWTCNGGPNQTWSAAGMPVSGGSSSGSASSSGGSSSGGSSSGGSSSGGSSGGTGSSSGSSSSGGGGTPLADLQKAQKFVSSMAMGADIERARITYMTYQGNVIGQSPDYFAYLLANGIDHIRIFYPWSPSFLNGGPGVPAGQVPPTAGMFEAMLQGALNANKAGVKVFFDLMDLTNSSDCQGASLDVVHAWLTAAAQRIAGYGFDPSMIAIGPINEPQGDTNAIWDPILQDLHDTLRQTLPNSQGWILSKGGANWADPGTFSQGGAVFSDQLVVYMVHYYPAHTPAANGDGAVVDEWAGIAKETSDYSSAHGGIPVVAGETGLWNSNDLPYGGAPDPGQGGWPGVMQDTVKGAGVLRPMPWAITDGSEPVSNGGADATLPPAVASAFQSAAAYIKSQSYYTP